MVEVNDNTVPANTLPGGAIFTLEDGGANAEYVRMSKPCVLDGKPKDAVRLHDGAPVGIGGAMVMHHPNAKVFTSQAKEADPE